MRVLIIDDSIDKISSLTEVINTLSFKSSIDNTDTISDSILLLKDNEYDIAIIDLYLPLRKGEEPNAEGGKQLVEEIYRKKENLNVPKFIIGFSQYEVNNFNFSPIWQIIKYEPSNSEWKNHFIIFFKHINHVLKGIGQKQEDEDVLPTILVEGLTDLDYINCSMELFPENEKPNLKVKSQSNAGANWVAKQIIVWAIQNIKTEDGSNIKAIGLLDSDEAGNLAKTTISERLKTQTEQNTFRIIQILPKYNPELVKFYKEKCKIELEIESLFPIEILEYAESKNWLEHRNPTFYETPKDWEQHNHTSSQYILSKGIEEKLLLYTKKVKLKNKIDFSKYVLSLGDKENVFRNFKPLITDLISALEIKK